MKGRGVLTVGRVIVALVVIAAAAFGAAQALGASEPITTTTTCCSYGKASFTIDQGTVATFQNADPGAAPHDVTAVSKAHGKPLFSSATINLGQTPVTGTDRLAPGTYQFFCAVHPTQMFGQLVVNSGPPSGVSVKILSRDLSGVASSGKLKIKLSAVTARDGVTLTASKGSTELGSKPGINLAASASRTVVLRLTRAGRSALKKAKSAKIKVTAIVPAAQPASATQRLR